jgi:hypothetical protein
MITRHLPVSTYFHCGGVGGDNAPHNVQYGAPVQAGVDSVDPFHNKIIAGTHWARGTTATYLWWYKV